MSSSIRRRLYNVLGVVLRVPPLFIMDSIFVNDMKLPQFYDSLNSTLFSLNKHPIANSEFNLSMLLSNTLNSTTASSHFESDGDDFQLLINKTSTLFVWIGEYSCNIPLLSSTNHPSYSVHYITGIISPHHQSFDSSL